MKWTKADKDHLLQFRKILDDDNTKLKEEIKSLLVNNKYITHVLNNKDLEKSDSEPEEYFGVNIFPVFIIPTTQTNVQNYICFETGFKETNWRTKHVTKDQQLIFYILCDVKNIIDKETGLARHDLLGALINEEMNQHIFSGGRAHLESDVPGVTDSNYALRTLTYNINTDANLVKTINGATQFVNHKL